MSGDLLGSVSAWRERYGDIFHLRIWPEHEVVVSDPTLVRELLVGHHDTLIRWERGIRVFSQLHGKSVLTTEGEQWQSKRHALQPSFTPKAIQAFVPSIASAAAAAFAQWPRDGKGFPIESALTSLAMDVIVRMMFSSDISAESRVAEQAVHATVVAANEEMFWPASWPDWMPWKRSKRRAIGVLDRLINRHIDARLHIPRIGWPRDLLSHLLELHCDDPAAWPIKAVRDECMTTFLAGHETAAATLTWWAWCLAANTQVQDAARMEVATVLHGRMPTAGDVPTLRYLTATLQETLRLYPAAPVLMSRRSLRPIQLGPWQLPKNTMFMIPVQLMHHDERWFPDPQQFRPERFVDGAPDIPRGAFMPFGTGPRVCLGQHLAMTEMVVVAAMFLQRFAATKPLGMPKPQPEFNISLRPGQQLHLNLSDPVRGSG